MSIKKYEGFWTDKNKHVSEYSSVPKWGLLGDVVNDRQLKGINDTVDNLHFPMPIANSFNPKFKESFLEKLKKVECLSNRVSYMGQSDCRLCNNKNGSVEYENGPWVWPSGYVHYIRDHNVAPSMDFYKFIKNYDISGISENILEYFIQKNQK